MHYHMMGQLLLYIIDPSSPGLHTFSTKTGKIVTILNQDEK